MASFRRTAGLGAALAAIALTFAPAADARECRGTVAEGALPPIRVGETRGWTCAEGTRVMRRVAPVLGRGYYERLGRTRNRRIHGFRCSGSLLGDASWEITCRRGRNWVRGYTAE